MSRQSGNTATSTAPQAAEDIEAAEAAWEFASLIGKESARRRSSVGSENYEVRPCTRVRGFTLKLPVLGWRLWYPTATDAVKFARRVAASYRADCFIYDATGQLVPSHPQN